MCSTTHALTPSRTLDRNPFFKDVKAKTVEPHIMHEFPEPFYGATLTLLVCAYMRPELDFDSLGEPRTRGTSPAPASGVC